MRAGGDVGVAVVVSGLFGLGGILALSPETPPRLNELLFGDLLGVANADLLVAALLAPACCRPRARPTAARRAALRRRPPRRHALLSILA